MLLAAILMKRESLQGISRQYMDIRPTKTAMTIRIITTPLHALLGQKLNLILLIVVIMETSFSASVILIPFIISRLSAGETGLIIVAYYVATLSASYFGYLSEKTRGKKIPEGCTTCEQIIDCMLFNLKKSKNSLKEIKKWYEP